MNCRAQSPVGPFLVVIVGLLLCVFVVARAFVFFVAEALIIIFAEALIVIFAEALIVVFAEALIVIFAEALIVVFAKALVVVVLERRIRRIIPQTPGKRHSHVSRSKINDLLRERHQRFTPLQRLLRHAANQETWTAELRALLPDTLRRDCQVVQVQGPTILVSCRSAASATKLRFLAPELLIKLKDLASFSNAREIRVRVSAEDH